MPALPFTKPIAEITATAPNTATKAKPYVCTTCTRPFARLEHLKRHERSHTKEKPFCCEMAGDLPGCGRRFARRDLLLRHQQKIHLCPNTSKRRRLSNSTASTNTLASRKSTSPVTDLRTQYTVTMPNLDDMKNYSHGTINPSSIFSSSPPRSARSSGDSPTFSDSQLPQQLSPDFSWATERLLPVEEQQLYEQMWPVPELALASSPSTMSSASWSPQYHDQSYSSLGQPNQLEMAGSDSDLFSPDFFIGNGTYQQGASSNLMMQQIQAQFMASQQFEQYATKPLLPMTDAAYITDASLRMQFAPDMAYCTSFRPEQQAMYGNFVETY